MKQNRKFTRAKIPNEIQEWNRLLGAKAHWPTHEQVDVYDLAYKGAAIGSPTEFNIDIDQKITLRFSLNPYGDILVPCRIAWKTSERIGLEFENISSDTKQKLDRYLDHKLIGQNLRAVDPRHFNNKNEFTDWFIGPKDTHVFLWRNDSSQITKAVIETEFGTFEFDGHRWLDSKKEFLMKVSDILSQIPQAEHPLKELAKTLPRTL